MKSALKSVYSQRALIAAMGLAVAAGMAPASAADLGGNCCADLEERIAELEATTARKGNRKVSLTISGWVNEAIYFWDDGKEQNVYIGTNNLERSRFKFAGKAKIDGDWSAGYTLEIGVRGNNSQAFSQDSLGSNNSLDVRKSSWFIENKNFGKVTVGLDGTSTYHLLDDADATNTRNYADAEAGGVWLGAFKTVRTDTGAYSVLWTDVLRGFNNSTPGQDTRRNIVRYDTPTLEGFMASASWGEDDRWDVAGIYANKLGDFKLAFRGGYGKGTDEASTACHSGAKHEVCEWWGVAGTIMHEPTGLYVYAGYGAQNDKTRGTDPAVVTPVDNNDNVWFVQGGIEQKWMALGKTTVFGEYRRDDAGSNPAKKITGAYILNSEVNQYAFGVVQNIDAAAMDLYLIYRHADGDSTDNKGVTTGLDDFNMVIAGGRIQF